MWFRFPQGGVVAALNIFADFNFAINEEHEAFSRNQIESTFGSSNQVSVEQCDVYSSNMGRWCAPLELGSWWTPVKSDQLVCVQSSTNSHEECLTSSVNLSTFYKRTTFFVESFSKITLHISFVPLPKRIYNFFAGDAGRKSRKRKRNHTSDSVLKYLQVDYDVLLKELRT